MPTRYNPQHNPRTHHRPEAAVTEPLWRGVAVALVTLFDAGGAPVLAYHFPGVVGGAVPVEALPELAISGIKDSTGDPERLLRTLDAWTGWTYVGSSTVVSYAGQLGASGAILAVANAVPEECLAAFDGDGAAQRRLIVAHLAARDRFPRGLKELVAQRFGTPTASRLG